MKRILEIGLGFVRHLASGALLTMLVWVAGATMTSLSPSWTTHTSFLGNLAIERAEAGRWGFEELTPLELCQRDGTGGDSDGDSYPDSCDVCTNDAANDVDNDRVCAGAGFVVHDNPEGDQPIGDNDNCPETSNPSQTDADGDGLGDACDPCPQDPGNDVDGDSVCGDVDNCPNAANGGQEDADGDGPGDACDICPEDPSNDSDGDGVCGDVDNCPSLSNSAQTNTDGDAQGDACDADDDNDLVLDDGDVSGGIGDNMCAGGDTSACDDNCKLVANEDQADADFDQIGDACDGTPDENDSVGDSSDILESLLDVPGHNGLITHLDTVIDLADAGRYCAALAQLDVYLKQLTAKIDNGQIPGPQATELLSLADALRANIQAAAAANGVDTTTACR